MTMKTTMVSELAMSELSQIVHDEVTRLVGKLMPIIEMTGMPEQQMKAVKAAIKEATWKHCEDTQKSLEDYLTYVTDGLDCVNECDPAVQRCNDCPKQ